MNETATRASNLPGIMLPPENLDLTAVQQRWADAVYLSKHTELGNADIAFAIGCGMTARGVTHALKQAEQVAANQMKGRAPLHGDEPSLDEVSQIDAPETNEKPVEAVDAPAAAEIPSALPKTDVAKLQQISMSEPAGIWTEARVGLLRHFLASGCTASEIAAEIPRAQFTRNAVIGKVNRIGLSLGHRKSPAAPLRKPRARPTLPRLSAPRSSAESQPTPPKKLVRRVARDLTDGDDMLAPTEMTDLPADTVASEGMTLMQLRVRCCRWPRGDVGTEEFRFCGADTGSPDEVYCSRHAQIAYQPRERSRHYDARVRRV